MPTIQPLLRDITGLARDPARDRMPPGLVWDLADWIPAFADAPLRSRDGWVYQSDALPAAAGGMIYAPYQAGDRLLVMLDNGRVADVVRDMGVVGSTIITPTVQATKANPVFYRDYVYVFDYTGQNAPISLGWNGTGYAGAQLPTSSTNHGSVGAVYHDRLVVGGDARDRTVVAFAPISNPAGTWVPESIFKTAAPVTGLAVMRNMLLVFHPGTVERIRGTAPPDPARSDPLGDMQIDGLFDRAGCFDARSIAYWNDNVIWADAHGVHITDGGLVRNLVSQGGILSLWRQAFQNAVSLAGTTFLDFYCCCLRTSDKPPLFLVCDIAKRTWYRFTNIDVTCMCTSVGIFERLWGTDVPNLRTDVLSAMWFPDPLTLATDADGKNVLTSIETGWFRVGKEGKKRIRNLYVSYDHRLTTNLRGNSIRVGYTDSPEATAYRDSRRMLRGTSEYTRRRVPLDLGSYGAAFRLQQTAPSFDFRLYDIGVDAWAQEEGFIR